MAGKKKFTVSLPHNPALERIIMGRMGSKPRPAQIDFDELVNPTDDLLDLLENKPQELKKPKKKRYSPLKSRPPCVACKSWKWIIVTDHSLYRDPFLECGNCKETFRMDLTPLDMNYAWRDKIPMPEEVNNKFSKKKKSDF